MPYRLVTADTYPHGFSEEYPTEGDWESEQNQSFSSYQRLCAYMKADQVLLDQVDVLLKQGRDWVARIYVAKATERMPHDSPIIDGLSKRAGSTRWNSLIELRKSPNVCGQYYSAAVRAAREASAENISFRETCR